MYCEDFVGKDPTKSEDLARHFLFHDCSEERAQWAMTTLRLMNARQAVLETCPLAAWPEVPSDYIVCSRDRTLRPDWWRDAARERLGTEPIEMDCGHSPHVSRPEELADILIRP
jgi:pimeloyl-ACP methyl ester carboxylesterase